MVYSSMEFDADEKDIFELIQSDVGKMEHPTGRILI